MSANKEKQNLRYQKISERLNKKIRYDGFSKEEITYLRTKEQYKQAEKDLNRFWREAPRNKNGAVNWSVMTEKDLDNFEYISKRSEKLFKKLNKLEGNGIDVDAITAMFIQLNCNSVSY